MTLVGTGRQGAGARRAARAPLLTITMLCFVVHRLNYDLLSYTSFIFITSFYLRNGEVENAYVIV